MSGTSKVSRGEIIGAGLSKMFISRLKLEGWIPIHEYFDMLNLGINLDWVLALTMEDDGFIAIPMVAEFRIPRRDSGLKPGWYKDEVNETRRIDDWTNVIAFKLIEKSHVDRIRDNILEEYAKQEMITDYGKYINSFNETVISTCKGKSQDNYVERHMLNNVN